MSYEIREFVYNGKTTYEVWQCTKVRGWVWSRYTWEQIKAFASFEAAEAYISKHAGGYYKKNACYYDDNGEFVPSGW